ncbi:MAG: hypothetical protein FWG53_05115 [Clostridiales bacterium]|nr:hypothetical protein [Clostridiales bacterium]
MTSLTRNDFLTTRTWHRAVVGGKDVILRHTSALEFLELFGGYMREKRIEVYAKDRGEYDNVDYCLVNTFDGIDYVRFGNVLCTSVNQTFNDMLDDFDNIDEQSLVEGLSHYFYTHGESFDGLKINPKNAKQFIAIKDWAIEYYSEG